MFLNKIGKRSLNYFINIPSEGLIALTLYFSINTKKSMTPTIFVGSVRVGRRLSFLGNRSNLVL